MSVEKANIKETFSIIKEAIAFKLDDSRKYKYKIDNVPLYIRLKKLRKALTLLKPSNLKDAIHIVSSVNYGKHILTCVFPKNENPEEYHSKNGITRIDEFPKQVLGWEDKKKMIQDGVELGLDKDWINAGFYIEAENRGIDTEWCFSEKPPVFNEENQTNIKKLN